MSKHNRPELFWNAETMAQALDVTFDNLMLLVQAQVVPAAVSVSDRLLWRVSDILEWTQALKTVSPAEAAALLWCEWQDRNDPRKNTAFGEDSDWGLFHDDNDGGAAIAP